MGIGDGESKVKTDESRSPTGDDNGKPQGFTCPFREIPRTGLVSGNTRQGKERPHKARLYGLQWLGGPLSTALAERSEIHRREEIRKRKPRGSRHRQRLVPVAELGARMDRPFVTSMIDLWVRWLDWSFKKLWPPLNAIAPRWPKKGVSGVSSWAPKRWPGPSRNE